MFLHTCPNDATERTSNLQAICPLGRKAKEFLDNATGKFQNTNQTDYDILDDHNSTDNLAAFQLEITTIQARSRRSGAAKKSAKLMAFMV